MSNEKMREEFEAWCISVGWSVQRCDMDENIYTWGLVCGAWKAWQASRASLCVELPKQWFDDDLECDLMVANRVLDALDDAGVRYK